MQSKSSPAEMQAGVCAKGKCAVPWSSGAQAGSAPPSGELPKSSVRDDSARNSVGPTEADCADKARTRRPPAISMSPTVGNMKALYVQIPSRPLC